jgi:predicted dehydrogenase
MSEQRISRRKFMQTTACVAGATLAGRSFLLDPGPSYASPRAVSAGETVRMGIIGVGMQGSGLLRTSIQLPGIECLAACDLYDGRRELAKEIVDKEIPTTRHYKELLDNKEIDCIVAAVPDHWHKQIVVDCCNAGKDVYCEKPMTHTVADGFEMIAAEQKNNRIVQIGSQRRSSIVYAKAKELYERGVIGDVCLVEASMGRNDPCGAWEYTVPPDLSPETLDWDTWLGTAPKKPFNAMHFTRWRCWRDYGEGIPGDLYVHLLTGVHYVTGITAPPKRAFSMGGLFRWKDGRDVPDSMTTVYEYPQFRATFRVTLNTETEEATRFMGTLGMLEIRNDELTMTPQQGVDYEPCTPGWPKKMKIDFAQQWQKEHEPKPATLATVESTRYYAPPDYNDDREHLWNFFESVRTRRPSVEDATFGNNTAIACHMANHSYFNNTIASWDAGKKRISG